MALPSSADSGLSLWTRLSCGLCVTELLVQAQILFLHSELDSEPRVSSPLLACSSQAKRIRESEIKKDWGLGGWAGSGERDRKEKGQEQ